MQKPKSLPLLDDKDFPINRVRQTMVRGHGDRYGRTQGKAPDRRGQFPIRT